MIKLEINPQVLTALAQAFPAPASPHRVLAKYISTLERLLFLSLQIPRTPEQSKLDLYAISLQKLANQGGQIGALCALVRDGSLHELLPCQT